MQSVARDVLAGVALSATFPTFAQENPAALSDCAQIREDALRLACFDRLAAASRGSPGSSSVPVPPSPVRQAAAPTSSAAGGDTGTSFLTDYWELDREHKRGVFNFRPHQINYLIATYTEHPNDAPYKPFQQLVPLSSGLSHSELAFQLGFKLKLLENPLDKPVDLWFGYTQNSFWQASNRQASSPFRETNYQPELMAVVPLNVNLFGVNARFVNLGLVHQSNGQASTLSRSWNRVYGQLGLERGGLTVSLRYWKRLHESAADDNNPDIVDYLGRGDLSATYRVSGHEFSALLRHNFRTGRGATQLGWAFPLVGPLKGYLQLFSGYGQSLIDYNYFQRSVGVGVMVRY